MNWFDIPLTDQDVEDSLSRCGVVAERTSSGYRFRCIVCGDSKTDLNKKRGFVLKKQERYTYYCHNCGYKRGFVGFLKDHFPSEHQRLRELRFLRFGPVRDIVEPETKIPEPAKPPPPKNVEILDGLIPARAAPPAVEYLAGRQIPEESWDYFYYSPNYNDFLIKKKFREPNLTIHDDRRIVVPFVDETGQITHLQGRAIGESNFRYITQTIVDAPKVWGMDHMVEGSTLYITEGVFDAVFLPNAIAMTGGSTNFDVLIGKGINPKRSVVCMDGDIYKNPDVRKTAVKAVDQGFGIFLFPSDLVYRKKVKDFNDLVVKEKILIHGIISLLNKFTYRGLSAKVMLKLM